MYPPVLRLQSVSRPKAASPVLPIYESADRRRIGFLKEKLAERTLPLETGPYRDREGTVENLIRKGIAMAMPHTLNDAALLLVLHLTPINYGGAWGWFEHGKVNIVSDPGHVHRSEEPMVAGELLFHSRQEADNRVTITGEEELAVLAIGIMRRLGYSAHMAQLIRSGVPFTYVLLLGDNDEALSLMLGRLHPSAREFIVLDDRQVANLLELHRLSRLLRHARPVAQA